MHKTCTKSCLKHFINLFVQIVWSYLIQLYPKKVIKQIDGEMNAKQRNIINRNMNITRNWKSGLKSGKVKKFGNETKHRN